MSNIEVGEYIRTNKGFIRKIDKIEKCPVCKKNEYINIEFIGDLKFENTYHKNDIVKHSKDIIDLIEVGDVVRVLDHEWDRIFNLDDEGILESFIEDINENNWELKSIVTKEQFKEMEYRVDE